MVLQGALIGAGFFAGFQAEAWRRQVGVEIVAVADPVPHRAAEFAARWGIARHYSDAQALLACEALDFVDIATRPDTHLPLTALAAGHGVHVICQKPMAPTWTDATSMVGVCDAAGVRLLIHENWRWQPWYRELRGMLVDGRLGTPFYFGFRMRTGDGRGVNAYPVQPYFREMERFLLQETAVHFLDTFRYLGGEMVSVFCRTARINPVLRGEDSVVIQLQFAGGAAGLIDANRISGPNPPPLAFGELVVEGDLGRARMAPDGRLWLTTYPDEEREHRFPHTNLGYKGDSVRAVQEHFVDCLCSGKAAESEGREYLKTVALVEACYRSADLRAPVRVDTVTYL